MKATATQKSARGFTLIETLVVMAIIVLLASIVVPALLGRKGEEPQLEKERVEPRVAEPAAGGTPPDTAPPVE